MVDLPPVRLAQVDNPACLSYNIDAAYGLAICTDYTIMCKDILSIRVFQQDTRRRFCRQTLIFHDFKLSLDIETEGEIVLRI